MHGPNFFNRVASYYGTGPADSLELRELSQEIRGAIANARRSRAMSVGQLTLYRAIELLEREGETKTAGALLHVAALRNINAEGKVLDRLERLVVEIRDTPLPG